MAKHCCKVMKAQLKVTCETHGHLGCSDFVMNYRKRSKEYGIVIHDGGSAMAVIKFCPWCGSKLPRSKRKR